MSTDEQAPGAATDELPPAGVAPAEAVPPPAPDAPTAAASPPEADAPVVTAAPSEPAAIATAAPSEPAEMDMAALLETEAAQPGSLRRGEIIDGVVMGASPDGVIVDVGTKTEAVIPQNEMLSLGVDGQARLKAGDSVRVMVLQPMSAEGHGVVSLDRARGEEGWDILAARLESGETFTAEIVGHNRGGVLANVEGVNAFIPLSQVDSIRRDDPDASAALATLVGKEVRLKVIEINRRKNRAILSERAAMAEWRREQKERIIEELREGEIREGRVSSITDFGVFVDLGGADGLAHLTELTWERGKKARDLYNVGDEVKAYVLRVDRETRKISLSLKRAHPEEWDNAVDRFVIGQVLIGRVTKLMPFGAFVRLDGPIEGLIHISEVTNRRIQHPREVLQENAVVPVKLVRIEKDRHRLGLSLRQARNDAEAMGFGFDRNGSVVDWPDDVREEFGLGPRETPRPTAPRTAQETVEQAVASDPEPVSAFAHAFAQALENAEGGRPLDLADEPVAEEAAVAVADAPVAVADEPAAEAEAPVAEVAPEAEASAEPVAEQVDVSAEVVAVEAESLAEPPATEEEAPVAEVEPSAEPVAAEVEVSAEAVATEEETPAEPPVAEAESPAEAVAEEPESSIEPPAAEAEDAGESVEPDAAPDGTANDADAQASGMEAVTASGEGGPAAQ